MTNYIRTPELLALIRKVFRGLVIVTAIVGGLGLLIGTVLFGLPGLWAALIATVLGAFFTATTIAGMYYAAGRGQQALMIVLLGGWLIKMIILGAVFFWLKNQTFYHKETFAATIIILVIGALIVEMAIVATARIPYVSVNSVTSEAQDIPANPTDSSQDPHNSAETAEGSAEPTPPEQG